MILAGKKYYYLSKSTFFLSISLLVIAHQNGKSVFLIYETIKTAFLNQLLNNYFICKIIKLILKIILKILFKYRCLQNVSIIIFI